MLRVILIAMTLTMSIVIVDAQEVKVNFDDLEEALLSPDDVEILILKREKYNEWPNELAMFRNLRVLDLSHNKIESLP